MGTDGNRSSSEAELPAVVRRRVIGRVTNPSRVPSAMNVGGGPIPRCCPRDGFARYERSTRRRASGAGIAAVGY
eukprot:COSAG02_NODE_23837_length_706_cov_1.724876_1_plen_73_part_01